MRKRRQVRAAYNTYNWICLQELCGRGPLGLGVGGSMSPLSPNGCGCQIGLLVIREEY